MYGFILVDNYPHWRLPVLVYLVFIITIPLVVFNLKLSKNFLDVGDDVAVIFRGDVVSSPLSY